MAFYFTGNHKSMVYYVNLILTDYGSSGSDSSIDNNDDDAYDYDEDTSALPIGGSPERPERLFLAFIRLRIRFGCILRVARNVRGDPSEPSGN